MKKIKVTVERLDHKTSEWVHMFSNVELTFDGTEICNRTLKEAFAAQHPELYEQIPTWKDERGFTYREYCNIEVV